MTTVCQQESLISVNDELHIRNNELSAEWFLISYVLQSC